MCPDHEHRALGNFNDSHKETQLSCLPINSTLVWVAPPLIIILISSSLFVMNLEYTGLSALSNSTNCPCIVSSPGATFSDRKRPIQAFFGISTIVRRWQPFLSVSMMNPWSINPWLIFTRFSVWAEQLKSCSVSSASPRIRGSNSINQIRFLSANSYIGRVCGRRWMWRQNTSNFLIVDDRGICVHTQHYC